MLDSSGSFGAGRSARPPLGEADIGALARRHAGACIEVLVAALHGTDVLASIEAAKTLLNLGYGAPVAWNADDCE
jgi:hypothetical protein